MLGGMDENLFGYFSICAMDKVTKEPFLLLSSTNNNDYCGDEIYFCRYNGKSRAGEGIPEVGCLGNFDIMLDEMYGMGHMWAEKNTLYVYTKKPGVNDYYSCPFIHREDLYYASAEEYEYTLENVGPDGKKGNSGYSVERVEEMLANGELAHIQWFSIEDIDSARAYYQEYVHGYIYTGSGTVANRDDYYNDTTPLKYIPYIESGVFALDERNGKVIYEFNNLDSEARNAVIYWGDHDYMKSDIQFRRGSDTTEVAVDIYDLGDGNWKAIARSYVLEKYGYCVRIEELSEEEVLSYYSYSDSSLAYPQEERQEVSSVAELLQIYGKN